MVHDTRWWPPISNCPFQSINSKLGFEASAKRPANDLARKDIQDDREIDKFAGETDVGYVGDPELIWS
jgi:hypothetical protein